MAKAVPSRRVPVSPAGSGGGGTTERGYLRGVWEELKKVIWPTPAELWRMTGIVIATVIIFALMIGAADFGLGIVVKQIYTTSSQASPGASPKPPANPAPVQPPVSP